MAYVRLRVPLETCSLYFTFRNFFAHISNVFGSHVITTNPASQPASQPDARSRQHSVALTF